MDAGKIKVVPNAVWEALRAGKQGLPLPGAAEDAPPLPGRGAGEARPGSPATTMVAAERHRGADPHPVATLTVALPGRDAMAARSEALAARGEALTARAAALAARGESFAPRSDTPPSRDGVLPVRDGALAAGIAALAARNEAAAARASVHVNLSSDAIAASRDPQLLARIVGASTPLPGTEPAIARSGDRGTEAMPGPAPRADATAPVEVRDPRAIAVRSDVAATAADAAPARAPAGAPRPESTGTVSGAAAQLAAAPEAGPRPEPQMAPLFASAVVLAHTATPDIEVAGNVPAPLRPLAELVAPFLVRQEPPAARAPYLNRLIFAAAALGLVMLLLL